MNDWKHKEFLVLEGALNRTERNQKARNAYNARTWLTHCCILATEAALTHAYGRYSSPAEAWRLVLFLSWHAPKFPVLPLVVSQWRHLGVIFFLIPLLMLYHILKQSPTEKLRNPIVIHSPPGRADLLFLPFFSFSLKCEEAMVWLISSLHCSECLLPCFCSPFSGGLELPRDESVGREKRKNRRFLLWNVP